MNTTATQPDSQYDTLIDSQTWAFIERTNEWYPPNTIDFSMQRQREIYNAMCREFHTGYPTGVSATDDTIQTDDYNIPVRRYTAAKKIDTASIVYFHGGGFVVGGLDSHDDVCAEVCAVTGLNVTAVDYRLAPEHLHPAAFNDCFDTVIHEYHRVKTPLILCGDSAGGNLAAAVSHTLRDSELRIAIAGQVLIYPALGGDTTKGSYKTHANAPLLNARDVAFYSTIRTGYKDYSNQVQLAPLTDNNFKDLPATVAFSAECDPLADDAEHYVAAIQAASGEARWVNEAGLVHGYLRARHSVNRARESFERICDALSEMAGGISRA